MKVKTWNRLLSLVLAASMTISMLPLSALAAEESEEPGPAPVESVLPSEEPEPSAEPSEEPDPEPAVEPSEEPQPELSEDPEPEPSAEPGEEPEPSEEPSREELPMDPQEEDIPVDPMYATVTEALQIEPDGNFSVTITAKPKQSGTSISNMAFAIFPDVSKANDGSYPSISPGLAGTNGESHPAYENYNSTDVLRDAVTGRALGLYIPSEVFFPISAEWDNTGAETVAKISTTSISSDFDTIKQALIDNGPYYGPHGEITEETTTIPMVLVFRTQQPMTWIRATADMKAADALLKAYDGPDPTTANEVTEIVINGIDQAIDPESVYIFNVGTVEAIVNDAYYDKVLSEDLSLGKYLTFTAPGSDAEVIGSGAIFSANGQDCGIMNANEEDIYDNVAVLSVDGSYYTIEYSAKGGEMKTLKLPIRIVADAPSYSLGDAVIAVEEGYTELEQSAQISVTTDTDDTAISYYSGSVKFANFTIGTSDTTAEITFTIPDGLTANGSPYTYRVTASEESVGSVASFNVTIYVTKQSQTYSYTITYNDNGGSGGPGTQTLGPSNSTPITGTLSSTKPTRTGYTFTEWAGNGSTYQPGGSITLSSDVTLTAQWTPNKITVKYDKGDVDSATMPNDDTATYGKDYKINSTTPTTTSGKTFSHYTYNGKEYSPSGTIAAGDLPVSGTITLTAVWNAAQYTVTYDANGHGSNPAPATVTDGQSVTLPDVNTEDPFTLLGWSINKNAATPDTGLTVGAPYKPTGNITLYAVWAQDTYTVTYAKGTAGSSSMSGVTLPAGSPFTVNVGETHTVQNIGGTAPTGYHFVGWNNGTSDVAVGAEVGGSAEKDSIITLTAQWEKNDHTVTYVTDGGTWPDGFDPVGGTENDHVVNVKYGDSHTVLSGEDLPTKAGYTFSEWKDGDGNPQAGTINIGDADVTLTAQWTINQYNVVFHYQDDNQTANKTVTVNYNTPVTKPTDPDRTGYNFGGWYTEAACTNEWDFDTKVTANTDLYAKWTAKTYTITYNANGGTSDNQTQTATIGEKFTPAVTDPVWAGHTFAGWATTANGGTTFTVPTAALDANYITTHFGDSTTKTVYAQWADATYTISGTITKNGTAWTGATVSFGGKTATTKSDGSYSISGVAYNASGKIKVTDAKQANGTTDWESEPITVTDNISGKNFAFYGLDVKAVNGTIDNEPDGVVIYPAGAAVAVTATADTHYEYQKWDQTAGAGTLTLPSSAGDVTITLPATGGDGADHEATVTFEKKTSDITINFKENAANGDDHTYTGEVELYEGSTGTGKKATATSATSVTITGVEHGVPYAIYAGGKDTGITITVTDSDKTANVIFYSVELATKDAGTGGVGFKADLASTDESAGPEWYLPGETVTLYNTPATNYQFTDWDKADGNQNNGTLSGSAFTVGTGGAAKLEAAFTRVSYSVKVTVKVNGAETGGLTVTAAGQSGDTKDGQTSNNAADKGQVTLNGLTYSNAPYTLSVADGGTDFVGTVTIPANDLTGANDLTMELNFWQVSIKTDGLATDNTAKLTVAGVDHTVNSGTAETVTMLAGTAYSITATPKADAAAAHYAFKNWTAAPESFNAVHNQTTTAIGSLKAGTPETAVTITANFKEQFKVTYGGAENMSAGAITINGVSFGGQSLNKDGYVMVDADTGMEIAALRVPAANKFSHWKLDAADAGTWGSNNHPADGGETFTPTADTTLTAVLWTKPTLTPVDQGYDKGQVTSATNKVPEWTWTLNDATAKTTVVEYQKKGTSGWTTLDTANYEVDDTSYKLKDTFLRTLEVGTYNIRFNSELKADDTSKFNGGDTILSSEFTISATANQITKITIGVMKNDSSDPDRPATALVNDPTGNREYVEYIPPHTPATARLDDMVWTWYYSDNPPAQGYNSTGTFNPAGHTEITDTDNTTTSASVPTTVLKQDAQKGKYIFAVVTGRANSSVESTGYYITNNVPVDYDAVITLNINDTAQKDSDNKDDGFKVWLREVKTGASAANTKQTDDIEALWDAAQNAYVVTVTGGKSYSIWSSEVEEQVNDADKLTKDNETLSGTTQSAAVDYYVVTLEQISENASTKVTHMSDMGNQSVGETFDASNNYPVIQVTTGEGTVVSSGVAVAKTTDITAKTNDWVQDYDLTWQYAKTGAALADGAVQKNDANKKSDNSDSAVATGITLKNIGEAKTISAKLEQNEYTVTVKVQDVSKPASRDDTAVTKSVLTTTKGGKTYTFASKKGTAGLTHNAPAVHDDVLTFKVPRAGTDGTLTVGETYSFVGTAQDNITVHNGLATSTGGAAHAKYVETVFVAAPADFGVSADVDFTTMTGDTQKTIDIKAAGYVLPPFDGDDNAYSAQTITLPYGYATEIGSTDTAIDNTKTYTIKFKNEGTGTMTDAYIAMPTDFNTYFDLDEDDSVVTKIGGTTTPFKWYAAGETGNTYTLAPDESITIAYTVKEDLHVVSAKTFEVQPTAKKSNGDTLDLTAYKHTITFTVEPTELTGLKIDDSTNSGTVVTKTEVGNTLAIESYTSKKHDIFTLVQTGERLHDKGMDLTDWAGSSDTTGDLEYQWYAVPNGTAQQPTAPSALQAGWAISGADGKTYMVTAADRGKTLYLLMTGHNDAAESVLSQGIYVDYPGIVEFFLDGATQKETDDPGYEVFFVSGDEILEAAWSDDTDAYINTNMADKAYEVYVSNWPRSDVDDTTFNTHMSNFTKLTAVKGAVVGDSSATTNATNVAKAEIFTLTLEQPSKANHYKNIEAWGENFTTYPHLTATVPDAKDSTTYQLAATSDTASSTVLKGQKVTVTAAEWTQDYKLVWKSKVGDANDYTEGNKDASGSAAETYTMNAKTTVSGEMEQNVYAFEGTVKDDKGSPSTDLAVATLTFKKDETSVVLTTDQAVTESGTLVKTDNTISGSTVIFTLPKDTGLGSYTLAGEPKENKTILDVNKSDTNAAGTPYEQTIQLDNLTDSAALTGRFTFHMDTLTNAITVKDNAEHSVTVDGTAGKLDTAENIYSVYYGYAADKVTEATPDDTKDTYTVTFENNGNTNLTVQYEFQVKNASNAWEPAGALPGDKLVVTNSLDAGKVSGSFDVTSKIDTGATKDVFTIEIPYQLKNNDDVEYRVKFTAGDLTAYYLLDFDVEPLEVKSAAAELADGKAQLENNDIQAVTLTDGTNDSTADTINGGELKTDTTTGLSYQWFSVPGNTAGTATAQVTYKADGTVNAVTLSVSKDGTTVNAAPLSDNGANTKQYTIQEADAGKILYLVTYGANNVTGNVQKWAVSNALALPYNGLVKISENGTVSTAAAEPHDYDVKLIDSAISGVTAANIAGHDDAIGTTWKDLDGTAGNGDEGYYADSKLDTTKTYHIWVETFPGSGEYVKLDKTLTNTSRTQTAEYFTVQYTADVAVDNKVAAVSSALAGPVKYGLSITVGTKALDTNTPVLAGQSAAVTMDYDAENAASEGWDDKQHYELEWTNAYDDTTPVTGTASYPGKDITHTMTVNGTTTGNGTKVISAQLQQKLYTLTWKIVDDGDAKNGALASVTLATTEKTGGAPDWRLTLDTTTADAATGSNVSKFTDGGTVTFLVPAITTPGEGYQITAVPAADPDTALVKYVWDSKDGVQLTGNVTKDDKHITDSSANEIHIIAAVYGLEWQSNYEDILQKVANPGFGKDPDGFNRGSLIYGQYGMDKAGGDKTLGAYILRVKNTGNKPLTEVKVVANAAGNLTFDLTKGTAYDGADAQIGDKDKADLTAGVSLPVGGYVDFTVDIPAGKDVATYLTTFTATAKEWVKADKTTAEKADYPAQYTVDQATITALKVTEIDTPKTGTALNVDHTLAEADIKSNAVVKTGEAPAADSNAAEKNAQDTNVYVTWAPADTNAQAGQAYTATVEIVAQSPNYKFDLNNYKKAYEILGKNAADDSALVTAKVDTITSSGQTVARLTLTYTFGATASAAPEVKAEAINQESGKVTEIKATSASDLDFYYVITEADGDTLADYFAEATGDSAAHRAEIITAAVTDGKAAINGRQVLVYGTRSHTGTASGGTAAWTGADTFNSLKSGTTYKVYAVAVPKGTAGGYADVVSPVGATSFTTYYEVRFQVNNDTAAQITAPTDGVQVTGLDSNAPRTYVKYVKPGEGLVVAAESKDDARYTFHDWAIFENADSGPDMGGIAGGEGLFTANNVTDAPTGSYADWTTSERVKFWPTANTTIRASYTGKPVLEATGTKVTAEYSQGVYDDGVTAGDYVTSITVYEGQRRVTNVGAAQLTGDLAFKVMPKGWTPANGLNAAENDTFQVAVEKYMDKGDNDLNGDDKAQLKVGDYAQIKVHPKAGLTKNGSPYEAVVVAYDSGSLVNGEPTILTYFEVYMAITDQAVSTTPDKFFWDMYPHSNTTTGVNGEPNRGDGAGDNEWKDKALTVKHVKDHELEWAEMVLLDKNDTTADADLKDVWAEKKDASAVVPKTTGYTIATVDDTTQTLTMKADYLNELIETEKVEPGDALSFVIKVTDKRDGAELYKRIIVTYVDTTPTVTTVTLPATDVVSGNTVTATVTAKVDPDGDKTALDRYIKDNIAVTQADLDANKVYVNWYRVEIGKDNDDDSRELVQGYPVTNGTLGSLVGDGNSLTYTIQPADAGYKIVAEAVGDIPMLTKQEDGGTTTTAGSWMKGSENDDLTPKIQVTVKNDRAVNGNVTDPVHSTTKHRVTPGEALEIEVTDTADGYYFIGWTEDDAAHGVFGAESTSTNTETDHDGGMSTKFWPKTDATITARFDLLPTLFIGPNGGSADKAAYTYDIGNNPPAGNTVPGLAYTQNDAGAGDPQYVLKPTTGSFTTAAQSAGGYVANGSDPYMLIAAADLTAANLKSWLTTGNYTITAYDVDGEEANETGKGEYSAIDNTGMTARATGTAYAGYDPSVTLTITQGKAPLEVTIVKDGDETGANGDAKELAAVAVDETMEAFHKNTTVNTEIETEGKVKYLWYYGETGLDLTKADDRAKAKPILVDDSAGGTKQADGKTLPVTVEMIDAVRSFTSSGSITMGNFYVLATADSDSAYTGSAADAVGVNNPTYTVAVRVSGTDDPAGDHTGKGDVKGSYGAAESEGDGTYEFTVQRGTGVSLTAIGATYNSKPQRLEKWSVYAKPGTSGDAPNPADTAVKGAFGAFSAAPADSNKTNSTSPATFYPTGDALIIATFEDKPQHELRFDDDLPTTSGSYDAVADKPADPAFARDDIAAMTYDPARRLDDITATLSNTSGLDIYHVTLEVTANSFKMPNGDATAVEPFGVTLPATIDSPFTDGKTLDIPVDMSKVKNAGIYDLVIKATGYSAEEDGVEVTATYTLKVVIDPKKLDGIKAEVPKPGDKFPQPGDPDVSIQTKDPDAQDPDEFKDLPDDVTPKIEWLKPDPEDPDNWIPVTEPKPDPDTPYKPVVTVEPGPNYEFTDDGSDDEPDDDYTINGKKDEEGDTEITVVPEYEPDNGPKAVLTGDAFPVLTFVDNYKEGQTPKKDFTQSISLTTGSTLTWDTPTITLAATGNIVYDVTVTDETTGTVTKIPVDLSTQPGDMAVNGTAIYTPDLSVVNTAKEGTYTVKLEAKGNSVDDSGALDVTATYTLTITVKNPGGGGGGGGVTPEPVCPPIVIYDIGNKGVTEDSVVEEFTEKQTKPEKVPTITAIEDYAFRGWTLTDPATLKPGEKPELVDPKNVEVDENTTFYAYYTSEVDHKHYVIGYPNGTFGPGDNISRGEVATIIARACLEGFVEGYDYGNPGGYSDVEDHWAYSAISYCSMHGVFNGYIDGTFRPSQPITRQELAVVVARLAGVQNGSDMPFSDVDEIGDWAVDGVYTTYINGWVNGYTDGTFKPLNNIRRDETVKIFNGYLGRGVDEEGLEGLTEYVHSGTASNNTQNGTSEYMTWPDVPKGHWAYYEIIEAGNDHNYHWHEGETTPPEIWEQVWIDEVWRYYDNANDSGQGRTNE